jgi:DnaJ-domain-containing protein 1
LYGVVTASTSGGLNLILHTSNMDAASSFSTGFEGFQNAYTHGIVAELPPSSNTNDSNAHSANGSTCPANIVHALTVLGLTPGATSEQVAIAFRHMAQMYHPDKTVGLGPELQRLADERMKEINAAHQTVKRLFENA